MKTIEERAEDYVGNLSSSFLGFPELLEGASMGYIKGATEQRKIDIEKACKWLRKIGAFSTLSFHDEEGVSQEVYEDMFRKAMED